ncbi:MAG: response regulator, partial [Pseudobdellovibrionaceae bacterium]|nr:response regulator [Pseudobdellovibrionaceae bacterium]
MNIVGNALKFTRDGKVEMTVKLLPPQFNQASQVAFIIADTGCGISTKGQTKLFTHFSQADNSTTRKFGGTGLGLVLSRNLARALGGDVVLQSSKVDEGSVFVVTIASGEFDANMLLSDIHTLEKPYPPAPVSTKRKQLAGMHVLLVEDAEDSRLLITRILKNNGATIDVAQDGIEAVDMARADHYDVVLMDIQMPLLDGYGALDRLLTKGYRQPVIALTAHALTEERRKTLKAGFCDHLTKPIDMKLLVETISRHVR